MTTAHPRPTIVQTVIPRNAATTITLIVGFAALTYAAAQVRIPIPGTPVPITGQTFAVLLAGAAIGARAGAASQALYWLVGALGLPVFAQSQGGWEAATGATGGYLIGFIAAAWAVGFLAERGQDRNVWSAVPAFLAGNAVIYLFGVPWLLWSVESFTTLGDALAAGFTPFVVGDLFKIVAAGLLLPAAWKLVDALRR